jgi:thiol-disulfide isomerase/thioredoxin
MLSAYDNKSREKIMRILCFCCLLLSSTIGWALQEGDVLGDLTIASQSQGNQRFKEHLGEVIVFVSWSSSCSSCHHLLSELDLLSRAYKTKGLTVYGVAFNGETKQSREHITYTLLPDVGGVLKRHLNIDDYPTVIMVNRSGIIEKIYGTYHSGDQFVYRKQIAKMLSVGEIQ